MRIRPGQEERSDVDQTSPGTASDRPPSRSGRQRAKKPIKRFIKRSLSILRPIRGARTERVFCVSIQRTGTTSVGKFFRDFGFRWAGWTADERNDWSGSWYEGNYDRIFSSIDFKRANAFEDSPWFMPGFYRVLFNRFPGSKFILFTRDPDQWFQSMVRHSGGNVLGRSRIHCKVYGREQEYLDLVRSGAIDERIEDQIHSEKVMKLTPHAEHYKEVYQLHSAEVEDFFCGRAPEALHVGKLEDPEKWQKLGAFLGLDVPTEYQSHEKKNRN